MPNTTVRLATLALLVPTMLLAQARNSRAAAPKVAASVHWQTPSDSTNVVRFTVKEQLAGAELPNDAVGTTKVVSGGVVIDGNGSVDSTASKITIDVRTLATDRANRDRYFKGRTIVTDSFPNATFVPSSLKLTTGSLTANGAFAGTMIGVMTLHGVAKQLTWDVTGTMAGDDVKGNATTHVHFGDFNMTQPRVMLVLSIVDDLKLDYDFHFVKQQ